MNGLSIIDSHVHLWNPSQLRYEWLAGVPNLNRPFLPADFAAASVKANVGKIIFVECGCEPGQSRAEVAWISDLAKTEPRLKGIVAFAPLEKGKTVRADLEELSGRPLVKGVRRNLQGEASLDFCLQPDFIAGVQMLAEFNFTFDLCLRHEQLEEVAELVRRVPEVNFVLDHLGKPDVRGKKTGPWAADLKLLAALPNVVGKISGLATQADWKNWQPADLKFYFDHALECFGFDRILFGGDWPVATLATDYHRWLETVQGFFSSAGEAELAKFFQTNAERIYHV
ncbi:MAG TPA: amidohydrolase family protein [Verrucomicrobiae bacterium]|jgi:L-fuconolactonase